MSNWTEPRCDAIVEGELFSPLSFFRRNRADFKIRPILVYNVILTVLINSAIYCEREDPLGDVCGGNNFLKIHLPLLRHLIGASCRQPVLLFSVETHGIRLVTSKVLPLLKVNDPSTPAHHSSLLIQYRYASHHILYIPRRLRLASLSNRSTATLLSSRTAQAHHLL